ncbi:MAG: PHP domain-containing protein [Bacillota bacterium]|nr:PHP domain-containing protein [Bacillota bacterium]
MEFKADLHSHTTYSDGRNTVDEMINAAISKGLSALAITDHGPNNIGTGVKASDTYYEIGDDIQRSLNQLEAPEIDVLLGAEADVIDLDGRIDIPDKTRKDLDWLIIGLHPYIWPGNVESLFKLALGNQVAKLSRAVKNRVKPSNTKALVESIYRYKPNCISHPDLQMAVDLEEVAAACIKTDTLYEINTGHRYQEAQQIKELAGRGVNFIVNSDSHYTETVGELDWGGELLEKANVPMEQIYNIRIGVE